MNAAFDIAVVGSGFAGSLIALIARQLGRSVVLLEKSKHPRFVIGESSTPLANLLLEELSTRYDLTGVRPLTKWGSWRASRPEIAVGLKRGFSFFHHQPGQPFADDPQRRNQLLVAASPHDDVADTHWYRPDFDAFLVHEAQQAGVTYLDEADLWGVDVERKRPVLQGRRGGKPLEIHAQLVIDASGPRGFLHRALDLPEVPFRKLPPTQAVYSHFTGVRRWDQQHLAPDVPPYPIDDAAMHHVFDGGWIWVLRFNNGLTSAGAAVESRLAAELNFSQGAGGWERLLDRLPGVREQFADAKPTLPFVHSKQLSFLSGYIAGSNWLLLPSAAGFLDPLLSTGFPLTLLGIERLASILESAWDREEFAPRLFEYSMQTTVELVTTERLIAALYATMHDFELFAALTLLYFAAASFTEATRRLGKPHLAGNTFLLGEHPVFGARFRYCVDVALQRPVGAARENLLEKIQQTIAPVNVAGLGDAQRRNWYPAQPEDLLANAASLDSNEPEIRAMLARCGITPSTSR